jgi:Ca2+-binding EF-hand superfamily protein
MGDKALTYEEYINSLDQDEKTKIKEIFELFDKNLDGGIDIKELKFILNCINDFKNSFRNLSKSR